MAKNPAVNFYTSDFLTSVSFMSNEQVGAYIKLLCYQHQFGHLSKQQLKTVTQDELVLSKFKKDDDNLYFNERMEIEIKKKQNYSESRAKNRSKKNTCEKDMKNTCETYEQHMENRNINININKNNLENKGVIGGEETFKVANDGSLLSETTKEVIDRLNKLAGTSYRASSNSTRSKIQARLNEGYTLNDFMTVIENKVRDWKNTDMAKYLRPETLFGNKFEGYLNQNKKIIGNEERPWWYGKNIEEERASAEEIEKLEKILNGNKEV